MKHRTDYPDVELKTALQWSKENKLPNDFEKCGVLLWCNPHHGNQAKYYKRMEVHEATKIELDEFLEPYRVKRAAASKKYREKKRKEKLIEEGKKQRGELLKEALSLPAIMNQDFIPELGIVLDLETTGLDQYEDEIVQISIIGLSGKVFLNTYVQPYFAESSDSAYRVHGIGPDQLKNAPKLHELIPEIKGILECTLLIIGYNVSFDLGFLASSGIKVPDDVMIEDVMEKFAVVYGEWNEYYGSYKWQSLEKCAAYYGYKFSAHDSLEDCRATLYCYQQINNENEKKK